jgi:hypothetical protein
MNFHKIYMPIAAISLVAFGCKKDLPDPVIPNQEELITTLNYTLISADNSDTATFSFTDIDGPGGNNPIIIADALKANTLYNGSVTILNEQVNPPENITIEIENEAEAHQFFYASTVPQNPKVLYADADMNGNPIGLATTLETYASTMGTLTITLRHNPNKSADGVKEGDITNAGGETDIEITFDVEIL